MTAPATPDTAPPEPTWSERNYTLLKVTVIMMGVLIVLGLIVVLGTIVNRIWSGPAEVETAPLAVAVPSDVATLLGPDAEVVSTVLDGSRLALVLKRPAGHSIVVIDLRSGRILNVISGEAAAP